MRALRVGRITTAAAWTALALGSASLGCSRPERSAPAWRQSSVAATAAPVDTPGQGEEFLTWDAATKTATFKLVGGPFVFNGYGSGEATLTLPPGSNVIMPFVQDDGTPHSAVVYEGEGPIPNSDGEAAIPRAYTVKLIEGLPQGAVDTMRFTAPDSGRYRIICGVPGHAVSGMWIWMTVDPAAQEPKFGPTTP